MNFYFWSFFLIQSCKGIISKNVHDIKISPQEYECTSLHILLDDLQSIVTCNTTNITLQYAEFQKYRFTNINCSVNIEFEYNHIYSLDHIMRSILPSLNLEERRVIFFSYYKEFNLLEPFIKDIPYENVEFWMHVSRCSRYGCEWEKYIDMIEDTNWRIVCWNNSILFHLNDDNEVVKPVDLPKNIGMILLIVFLAFLPFMILSNCYIAAHRNIRVSSF